MNDRTGLKVDGVQEFDPQMNLRLTRKSEISAKQSQEQKKQKKGCCKWVESAAIDAFVSMFNQIYTLAICNSLLISIVFAKTEFVALKRHNERFIKMDKK